MKFADYFFDKSLKNKNIIEQKQFEKDIKKIYKIIDKASKKGNFTVLLPLGLVRRGSLAYKHLEEKNFGLSDALFDDDAYEAWRLVSWENKKGGAK